MSQAAVALIILAVVMILFVTETLPLPVTALLGALAMAVFGIIGFDQAFAGFGNDTLMMVAGMLVIGQAVCETGVVDRMGGVLERLASLGERSSIALVSLVAGALFLIATRCIDLQSVVRNVDWSAVIILGGSLGFSAGLEESGAGVLVANAIIGLCGGEAASSLVIFGSLVVITAVLSNFMSNTAVVAMLAPMGLFLAETLGFSPLAMTVGIVLAASVCLATPIGSPPMTLTLSAGYRFGDYLKVGAPLCVLLVAAIIVFVPMLYGAS